MAAQDDGQERTHEATERRKQQFRERGEIPRSREVGAAFSLAATILALSLTTGPMLQRLRDQFLLSYSFDTREDLLMGGALAMCGETLRTVAIMMSMPLSVLLVVGLLSAGIQSQGVIPKEPLKLRWETFDLANGFKQKFLSSQPLMELGKSLLKLLAFGWLVWLAIRDRLDELPILAATDVGTIFETMGDFALLLAARALPVALVVAVADYAYQRWRLQERMRMSHQELKEEFKEMEGDPHMKAARKARQRQIAFAQTLRYVEKADLVITNPTHYAVAIRYRTAEAPAPVVVAMGVDHLALRVRAEANRHDIAIVENRPLARALYADSEEGAMIPEELYGPVAKVLAVVLRRRKGGKPQT